MYRVASLFIIGAFSLLIAFAGPASPDEQRPPERGIVRLDRDRYDSKDILRVTVTDSGPGHDPRVRESLEVKIAVWRGADQEVIRLVETGPGTKTYVAELRVNQKPVSPGDGELQVAPGQVVEAVLEPPEGGVPVSRDLAMINGGRFSYSIDSSLRPPVKYVGKDANRPVAVVVNPGGFEDYFVANELIASSGKPELIALLQAKYGARILHDGRLGKGHPATPKDQIRQIPLESSWVLLRIDPAKADLTGLERKMTERGLEGKFTFSSSAALRTSAIVLAQQSEQWPVTLNFVTTDDRCPCSATSEDPLPGGGNADAFDFDWLGTLDTHGDEFLGVTQAWQLLDGLGIPDDLPNDLIGHTWDPVRFGVVDGGFEPNSDWPGGALPAWCLSSEGTFASESTVCTGTNPNVCTGGAGCPWHGTGVFLTAAGVADNAFGSAGTAATCGNNLVEGMLSRSPGAFYASAINIREQIRAGADVVNRSASGDCNWWCDTFGGFSGRSILGDTLGEARDTGVLVVVSAGNDGLDLDHEHWWGPRLRIPCELDGAICVGMASTVCNAAGCFEHNANSNFGANVDIWAPESAVVWAPAQTDVVAPFPAIQRTMAGTSIAAPYVAGVLVMIKALYPPADRDDFDHAAAMALIEETAWSPATTAVSTSARVNVGGLINAYEMVRRQAELLGLEETAVDENEPNDTSFTATAISVGDTESGIISSVADLDTFGFNLDDYYDVTASILSESWAGELQLSSDFGAGPAAVINGSGLRPGSHRFTVEPNGAGVTHPFNCFDLQMTGSLANIAPDVFDDGDPATPPPDGSSISRNDSIGFQTILELVPDPLRVETSLSYSDLNFDTLSDHDYFQFTIPPNDEDCVCMCGLDFCSSTLRITVTGDRNLRVVLVSPDDWEPIEPYREGWEYGIGSMHVIEMACPKGSHASDGRSVATADGEMFLLVEPRDVRNYYDLEIEYEYLNRDSCGTPDFPPAPAGMLDTREPDPGLDLYPSMSAFLDCESDPLCDPAEELYGVLWLESVMDLRIAWASPVEKAYAEAVLLDGYGRILSRATARETKGALTQRLPFEIGSEGSLAFDGGQVTPGKYYLWLDASSPIVFSPAAEEPQYRQ